MRYKPVMVGKSKVQRQMWGIPVFYADEKLVAVVPPIDLHDGVPGDCEKCAIAKGTRQQLVSPGVRIGLSHAYIAVPMNTQGVEVEGYEGKYGVLAFHLGKEGRRIVTAVDRGEVDEVTSGSMVVFHPRHQTTASRSGTATPSDEKKRAPAKIEQGVRNYSGRVWS